MCAQAGLSFFDARLSLSSKRERKIKLANQLAQGHGELTVDQDATSSALNYYPLTLILGSALEQAGQANPEMDARRLFQLTGRAMPYLGIRWQQSSKCRTPRLWNAGAANKQTGAVRQINRPEEGVK